MRLKETEDAQNQINRIIESVCLNIEKPDIKIERQYHKALMALNSAYHEFDILNELIMNEQPRLYNKEIIHISCRGLCSKCQKVLWMDCNKRYVRVVETNGGYTKTIECEGFEPVVNIEL